MIPSRHNYPDLVVTQCPIACDSCAGTYINIQTRHRIICHCSCSHKTKEATNSASQSKETAVIANSHIPSKEGLEEYDHSDKINGAVK
jgi:hypothetical protein